MSLENKVKVHFNQNVYGKMKPEVVAAFNSLDDAKKFAESIAPTGTPTESYTLVEVKQGNEVVYKWSK